MKAFMLAGVSSGIGKTTISMALMSAFNNVSPFKVGPDYIDPGFHEFITGNKSYNLDIFMMGEQGVKYSFYKHHKNISIVEGVMGLYDGIDNSLDNNSSAHIARFLGIPVILVLDGIGKSTSIAAQVLGYKMLDPRVNIAGVIINKVSSAKTYAILKEAIENYTGVKCLGFIEKNDKLNISSRHLGLLQANEVEDLREKLSILRNLVLENIDLKEIEKALKNINLDMQGDKFYLNDIDVSTKIREKRINKNVSKVASIKIVRDNLVNLQRKISNNKNVILDGRDIGTVVFPNAKVKIFLVATAEERARRRYNEFLEKKVEITYDEVLKSLKERDYIDSTRKESPLKKADDAIELDTTNLTIEDVINFIAKEIEKNIN